MMEKLITSFIVCILAILGALFCVPLFIYLSIFKQFNLKELIKLYKYLWESK